MMIDYLNGWRGLVLIIYGAGILIGILFVRDVNNEMIKNKVDFAKCCLGIALWPLCVLGAFVFGIFTLIVKGAVNFFAFWENLPDK